MAARYAVRNVDMGNGERMPLLIDLSTGFGVFEPTAWALSLRSALLEVNTIALALSTVSFLYETLAHSGVNLMDRVRDNDLLSLAEVEGLVARCKYDKVSLRVADELADASNVSPHRNVLTKNKAAHYDVETVMSSTTEKRLLYIAKYLDWLADYAFLSRIPPNRKEFRGVAALVVGAIRARTPNAPPPKKKKGLTKQSEERLLAVIDPTAPENPWKNSSIRKRNRLIVRLLRDLGIRKGELLGVKIEDINFADNTLFISRRPDDPEDPRNRQPEAKTLERTLPMGDDLVELLRNYVDEDRASIPGARLHPFLVVGSGGMPLALNSVDLMFKTLREKFPELGPVSAHILRHTWNDSFSGFAKGRMSGDEERKIRNYLMGWSKNSKMAADYTARFVEEEGRKASLAMQNTIYRKVNK